MERKIGQYTGQEKGTLIIALAAMHGNEPAGIRALRDLFQLLEEEPKRNWGFNFKGRLVGLIGNIQAYERRLRYVKTDLNRHLTLENYEKALQIPTERLIYEDLELIELLDTIRYEIDDYKPSRLIVLDLHTTSAAGGIFSIVSDDEESLRMAAELKAPVVLGMVGNTGGTTLHYFKEDNTGIPTVTIVFEAGQHEDAFSVQRTIAWLVNLLRTEGVVAPEDVESRHDIVLKNYSKNLPKIVELIDVHHIQPHDQFLMREGFVNFQPVKKEDVLADDKNGEIKAPEDCLLLMPLYQKHGTEGFFLVKERKT
ncbi:MAG: succinylglutamate desuccinylase/aspartoacylase family protein [Saprospiraceae bacterium]|nr:succinylglutamate desuccinylase/aspartoacylase family protein [Saprospiraceae bacterium]